MKHLFILACLLLLLTTPVTARAGSSQIPNCEEQPQDLFCQGQCAFVIPLPPWCAPPEPERAPIVIIPGITVSQNKQVLYKDEESPKWKFAFGFNVYKGLIKKLEAAGYEQEEDLFIAHYDWRQSAAHNASSYLVPVIQQAKQETNASKVDIVAHSFGGIVARAYVQGENYNDDIDQLITLGSPHRGAADAYVAWEGGVYPEGWSFFMKRRINKIESTLKTTRNQKHLQRPLSFRAFFPSLQDMLPINDFTRESGELMPIANLAAQNTFLQSLHDTFSLISERDVDLFTIAGAMQQTLDNITLSSWRSPQDLGLERWRDGHANPDPPPLDSSLGDARVLLTSAHLGSDNTTLNNTLHHKLPEAAQEQVLDILGLEEVAEHFMFELPTSIFGITILSPLNAVVEGPNGEVLSLSPNQNGFGAANAEYDDDLNDPNDPKDITIIDPPPGQYIITYTGSNEGEYTIITTYADEDETVSSTRYGTTEPGQVFTQTVTIENNTTSLIDDTDIKGLLNHIIDLTEQRKKNKLITGREEHNIKHYAKKSLNELKLYEKDVSKQHDSNANKRLQLYQQYINQLEGALTELANQPDQADFASELLQILEKIQLASPAI